MDNVGLKKIVWGMVVFLPLLFPLYKVEMRIGGVPFSVLEGVVYLAWALWVVVLLRSKVRGEVRIKKSLVLPFFAILVVVGLSLVGLKAEVGFEGESYYPLRRGLGIMKQWFVAPVFYVFLLAQVAKDVRSKEWVKRFFMWGVVGLALASFFWGEWSYDGRLNGFEQNANYMALYLAPAVVMAVGEFFKNKRRNFWEAGVWLLVLVPVLLMTRSYGAWLAVGGVLLVWFLLRYRRRWSLVVLGLVGLGLLISESSSDKFGMIFKVAERSSTAVRLEIWQVGLGLWKENFWTGIGAGNFQLEYWQEAWEELGRAPKEWNVLHAHNLYLQWLVEAGVLGLLVFIWLVVVVMRRKTLSFGMDLRWVMAVILVQGLFDLPLWKDDLAWEFFMIAGLIIGGHHLVRGVVRRGGEKKVAGVEFNLPTLNFKSGFVDHLEGVYAVWVYWRAQRLPGVLFSGEGKKRGVKMRLSEIHVLDFEADLYGERVEVEVVGKVREVEVFGSEKQKRERIRDDCERVRKMLA